MIVDGQKLLIGFGGSLLAGVLTSAMVQLPDYFHEKEIRHLEKEILAIKYEKARTDLEISKRQLQATPSVQPRARLSAPQPQPQRQQAAAPGRLPVDELAAPQVEPEARIENTPPINATGGYQSILNQA